MTKRGGWIATFALFAALLTAQPAGATWSQQSLAVPSGATTWEFSGVSCWSATGCMAVGSFATSNGQGILGEVRSASGWTQQTVPNVSNGSAELAGISCPTSTSCLAVGTYRSGSTTLPFAETWDGSGWSIHLPEAPAGGRPGELLGVSCASTTACTAVGDYTAATAPVPLAERWDGTDWTFQYPGEPSDADVASFASVSCPTASICTAVGSSTSGSATRTLAERWNGSSWTVQPTSDPPATSGQLLGVSCPGPKACMAVGPGIAEEWTAHQWASVPVHAPGPHGSTAYLDGVSCANPSACVAVGSYYKDAVQTDLVEGWTGDRWVVQSAPIGSSNDSSGLNGVSCWPAMDCTAAGFSHTSGFGNRGLAEVFTLAWQGQQPAVPTNATDAGLGGVSCPKATACQAVGFKKTSSGGYAAIAEAWDGTAWSLETPADPGRAGLTSVSCTGPTVCTAVGTLKTAGVYGTLAERGDGTAWHGPFKPRRIRPEQPRPSSGACRAPPGRDAWRWGTGSMVRTCSEPWQSDGTAPPGRSSRCPIRPERRRNCDPCPA